MNIDIFKDSPESDIWDGKGIPAKCVTKECIAGECVREGRAFFNVYDHERWILDMCDGGFCMHGVLEVISPMILEERC